MSRKIINIHDVEQWFGSKADFLTYFENEFKKNTMGDFKVQASVSRRNYNLQTLDDKLGLAGRLANIAISVIQASAKRGVLKSIPFNLMLPETQSELREGVAEIVQNMVLNKQIWERVNASSVSTPSFSINNDTTNWLLSNDMIGMIAKNAITNSGVGDYKIVGDAFVSELTKYDDGSGTIILKQWDNTFKGKKLGTFDNITDAINSLVGAIQSPDLPYDKFDYVLIKNDFGDDQIWRYEGGDFSLEENWDRKDWLTVDAKRYLIYKGYILAGSEGKKGRDGKDGAKGDKGDKADIDSIKPEFIIGGIPAKLVTIAPGGTGTAPLVIDAYTRDEADKLFETLKVGETHATKSQLSLYATLAALTAKADKSQLAGLIGGLVYKGKVKDAAERDRRFPIPQLNWYVFQQVGASTHIVKWNGNSWEDTGPVTAPGAYDDTALKALLNFKADKTDVLAKADKTYVDNNFLAKGAGSSFITKTYGDAQYESKAIGDTHALDADLTKAKNDLDKLDRDDKHAIDALQKLVVALQAEVNKLKGGGGTHVFDPAAYKAIHTLPIATNPIAVGAGKATVPHLTAAIKSQKDAKDEYDAATTQPTIDAAIAHFTAANALMVIANQEQDAVNKGGGTPAFNPTTYKAAHTLPTPIVITAPTGTATAVPEAATAKAAQDKATTDYNNANTQTAVDGAITDMNSANTLVTDANTKQAAANLAAATTGRPTYKGTFVQRDRTSHTDNPALAYPADAAAVEAEFNAITTSVANSQFYNQNRLTSVSLPDVTRVEKNGFIESPLVSLSIDKATFIGSGAFAYSKLTTLSLPEALTIEQQVFLKAPLTTISIPKATTIGDGAFESMVNAASTHVTMRADAMITKAFKAPVRADSREGKDRLFSGGWSHITFTWL